MNCTEVRHHQRQHATKLREHLSGVGTALDTDQLTCSWCRMVINNFTFDGATKDPMQQAVAMR